MYSPLSKSVSTVILSSNKRMGFNPPSALQLLNWTLLEWHLGPIVLGKTVRYEIYFRASIHSGLQDRPLPLGLLNLFLCARRLNPLQKPVGGTFAAYLQVVSLQSHLQNVILLFQTLSILLQLFNFLPENCNYNQNRYHYRKCVWGQGLLINHYQSNDGFYMT